MCSSRSSCCWSAAVPFPVWCDRGLGFISALIDTPRFEEEEEVRKLVFYAQSTSAVISGREEDEEDEEESKLVFYAQSTSVVISGR